MTTERPYRRRLTPAREAKLCRDYEDGASGKALSERYGASDSTIYNILARHGVQKRPGAWQRGFAPNLERAVCSRYTGGEWTGDLARELVVNRSTVTRILRRNGVTLRSAVEAARKYRCDHSFFTSIDSEQKAYWLGFIAADGNVDESQHILRIGLAPKDREHLYRFKRALGSEHPVTDYTSWSTFHQRHTTASYFAVRSRELVGGLVNNGVGGRKTFAVAWPDHLEHRLLRHYLRGLVDGDGGLYAHHGEAQRERGHGPSFWFGLTSNVTMLEGCRSYLMAECGFKSTKLVRKRDARVADLRYSGKKQVARIFRLLYEDATVYLPRKRGRIATFLA